MSLFSATRHSQLPSWPVFALSSVPPPALIFFIDYAIFASDDFDANEYANAVLAGEQYDAVRVLSSVKLIAPEPSAKEDISIAISKLTFGVDDVSKQIKTLVCSFVLDSNT